MKQANIAAVILAAGSGSRMGGYPKPLIGFQGKPLLGRLLYAMHEVKLGPIVLVLGYYANAIAAYLQEQAQEDARLGMQPITDQLKIVINPKPETGQGSSLRLGLLALAEQTQDVLIALADQALIQAIDLQALVGAYHQRPAGAGAIRPWVNGKPGNPIIISNDILQAMLSDPHWIEGKDWFKTQATVMHRWESKNQHYLVDLDNQDDLKRLGLNPSLSWPT